MSDTNTYKRFMNIGFTDFKTLAEDESLSDNEKIGFPDSYRDGFDHYILEDINLKLGQVKQDDRVMDIGPGCGPLAVSYINKCIDQSASITLVDSEEMLRQLPNHNCIDKLSGFYPDDVMKVLQQGQLFNKILCYSVFQYINLESQIYRFLDQTLNLLAPEGQFLLADIPNYSMRQRFFQSEKGQRFISKIPDFDERERAIKAELPDGEIDDSLVISLITRARSRGFHAYILPQSSVLPMSSRREDLLFVCP